MKENKRQDLLDRMKNLHKNVERGREDRNAEPIVRTLRKQDSFEDLVEYKQVLMQQRASAEIGVVNPFYRAHESGSGATAQIGGRIYDNFASYDYLGLNRDDRIVGNAKAALDQYGVSASASRLVAGERTVHNDLERSLAEVYDADDAVVFVSGYLTNVAAIGCLMGPKDLVIHDEFMHNSGLTGVKLSGAARRFFKHNDMADLERILRTIGQDYDRILVVAEGIYSMDGDIADLPGLIKLKKQYNFWLMMDEAHSLGVLGETGRGAFQHFGVSPSEVDIWMGTMSKTTSSCGGYIAGSKALITLLKAHAGGFVYSVGLAPALAAAALTSLEIMKSEPERVHALRRNSQLLLDCAREKGLDTGLSEGYSVVPVIVADSLRAVQLSNELFEAGVNVLPIIHPAVPEGLARLRFFITSAHSEEQIRRAVDLTATILTRLQNENFGIASSNVMQVIARLAQG
ncbi:aminotransferase class I/II-fold pyridoxal phosphate-dependent enzyme [Agrobacterium sp. ES01]|uniref:aminotransferase class I/II-fold pyridoxal phosphate-dependent enzyme n=1 Tax=Agrobacterium sp. ES01 TaxID=3420714 RepID=UPI003D15083B